MMQLGNRWKFFTGLVLLASSSLAQAMNCEQVFTYKNASAKQVLMTGSFTNWAGDGGAGAAVLSKTADTWSIKLTMPEGKNLYKFIVDGSRWISDPLALSN